MSVADEVAWACGSQVDEAQGRLLVKKEQLLEKGRVVQDWLKAMKELEARWNEMSANMRSFKTLAEGVPAEASSSVISRMGSEVRPTTGSGVTTDNSAVSVATVNKYIEECKNCAKVRWKLYEEQIQKFKKDKERNFPSVAAEDKLNSYDVRIMAKAIVAETDALNKIYDQLLEAVPLMTRISVLATAKLYTENARQLQGPVAAMNRIAEENRGRLDQLVSTRDDL